MQEKKTKVKGARSFDDIKAELNEISSLNYNITYIFQIFRKKPELRKVYTALMRTNPSRYADIDAHTFSSKDTNYRHLHKLRELGVVEFVSVIELYKKKDPNENDLKILSKFEEWTRFMSDNQRNLYSGKTRYFILTDLGKNVELAKFSINMEREEKAGFSVESEGIIK